mgnify:CR=1 FL=1
MKVHEAVGPFTSRWFEKALMQLTMFASNLHPSPGGGQDLLITI